MTSSFIQSTQFPTSSAPLPTPIFLMEFGSFVYGTNLPTSDKDYKGIFLPQPRDIILGLAANTISTSTRPANQTKNTQDDTDIELFSLKQYLKLLLEGQVIALTMLFAPAQHIVYTSSIYETLKANTARFLHKDISPFLGYCRQQANKYGIKGSRVAASRAAVDYFGQLPPSHKLRDHWPTIISHFSNLEHVEFLIQSTPGNPDQQTRMLSVCNRKVQEHITVREAYKIYKHLFDEYGARTLAAERQKGVDWKAVMHAVRVAGEAHELLTTHTITYPRPEAQLLLQIRKGELKYQAVAALIENGLAELEEAQRLSTLPSKPDAHWAEDFLYETYRAHIA